MSGLDALWLGLVQGLTEFFPVSSSGHLVMLKSLLGVEQESGLLFEIALHLATLFAIVLFYRRRIDSLVRGVLARRGDDWLYAGKLALATLPAVVVGLFGRESIERQFANPAVAGVDLLITGAILYTTRRTARHDGAGQPSWPGACAIGLAQAFAILPGISRSGSTVAIALFVGMAPVAAAEFSFLLGVIAIAGAAVLMLPEVAGASSDVLGSIAIGGVAALVSGIAAIWLFVAMLERRIFHLFAYYTWVAGGAFLAWLWYCAPG